MQLLQQIPNDWRHALAPNLPVGLLASLDEFLENEYQQQTIYPARENILRALELSPFQQTRVLILGQDPYHEEGQACGLAFSVPDKVPAPPSLRNIIKEYVSDLQIKKPEKASLLPWARRGVLLLNAVLTVRSHAAGSHHGYGWEAFTDAIIKTLSQRQQTLAFILWGKKAQCKTKLIDSQKHLIIQSAHPSPLSAYRGFFGSKPFSLCNQLLLSKGEKAINWQLD